MLTFSIVSRIGQLAMLLDNKYFWQGAENWLRRNKSKLMRLEQKLPNRSSILKYYQNDLAF